jgi:hypothetical protein
MSDEQNKLPESAAAPDTRQRSPMQRVASDEQERLQKEAAEKHRAGKTEEELKAEEIAAFGIKEKEDGDASKESNDKE